MRYCSGRFLFCFRSHSNCDGRRESDARLHAALHREVAEETALRIEIIELAGWREVLPGSSGGHYLIMSFAARWLAGEPHLNEELDDFGWHAPDAVSGLKVTDGLAGIIQSARRLISG